MNSTISEILEFVEENDVKFIRLAFCDIFGRQKNISIMPAELPRAFESGISFDASAIKGFMNVEESDLFLYPDPSTLTILPWRPSHGRVIRLFCDIKRSDQTPFEGDSRYILKKAVNQAREMGYTCKIGTECEFYLFETDERGTPVMIPQDNAGYCDIAPLDKGENVRREICLSLEKMGIFPESSHHEQGPGQNEIDFKYSDILTAADNLNSFKTAVKSVASANGLYASFMPKPFMHRSGSGLHINISLYKNGVNLFQTEDSCFTEEAEFFIAGILERIAEITAFLNPLTNSYARFGSFEAPKFITWSRENRSQLIRIPAAKGDYSRMELRSPDPSCHVYLTFALLLYAGLEGIQERKPLCPPVNKNLYQVQGRELSDLKPLPSSLEEAMNLAVESDFVRSVIPESTLEKYFDMKREEWVRYKNAENKMEFEQALYFSKV